MPEATTQGIRVSVESRYLPQQSNPVGARFVFAYTITIENQDTLSVQLRERRWVISDGANQVEEVRGEGVVGETPNIAPGEVFQYTSGCVLKTPWGTMRGAYIMRDEVEANFEVEVPEFLLAVPKLHTLASVN